MRPEEASQQTCGYETDRSSNALHQRELSLYRRSGRVSHGEEIIPLGAMISPRLLARPGLLPTRYHIRNGPRSCFRPSRKHPASERERPCSRLEFAVFSYRPECGKHGHIKYPELKSTTPTPIILPGPSAVSETARSGFSKCSTRPMCPSWLLQNMTREPEPSLVLTPSFLCDTSHRDKYEVLSLDVIYVAMGKVSRTLILAYASPVIRTLCHSSKPL